MIDVGEIQENMNLQKQPIASEESRRQDYLRRRLEDPDKKKQFRKAFAFKAGADYTTLKPFCDEIIVAVDGYIEPVDVVRAKLELAMADYDSDKDVIVVIGRSIDNLMVGMIVAEKVRQKPKSRQSYAIAVYYGYSYRFYEVYLDPTIETHLLQKK